LSGRQSHRHYHKTISIREEDYDRLLKIGAMLQIEMKRPVSFCEIQNYVLAQVPQVTVKKPSPDRKA